jgi:hypothetical protein
VCFLRERKKAEQCKEKGSRRKRGKGRLLPRATKGEKNTGIGKGQARAWNDERVGVRNQENRQMLAKAARMKESRWLARMRKKERARGSSWKDQEVKKNRAKKP